ncbi:MAG: YibE/F family protein [Acidimicrobiales bacterium]|nr:YibE/F family protein [Acidimicrobiales bacterium]
MGAHAHDHGHDHSHDLDASPGVARLLQVAVGLLVVLTVAGLLWFRPGTGVELPQGLDAQGQRVEATVIGDESVECAGADFGSSVECREIRIEITSGPSAGTTSSFEQFPDAQMATPDFETGDRLVVNEYELGDTGEIAHTFADFQRSTPMLLLAALFVVAVVALGRFQGIRAIGGLAVSAVVLLGYVFPALLDGQAPLGVALAASSVIAFAALYLAHGVSHTTTVALLGTMAALGLTGLLAAVFTSAASITGLATEDQIFLLVSAEGIDISGLVLAGIVLGSLGVLDDVTVTQVSAVARLREANPEYGVGELYRTGVRIGRDHIASTVNTLVLAYAGASLPLLLFYANVGIGLSEAVTSEIVAVEVIRTLVGSVGLVAAVPITTALAAVVVTGTGIPTSWTGRARRQPSAVSPSTGSPSAGSEAAESEPAGSDPDWDEFAPDPEDF